MQHCNACMYPNHPTRLQKIASVCGGQAWAERLVSTRISSMLQNSMLLNATEAALSPRSMYAHACMRMHNSSQIQKLDGGSAVVHKFAHVDRATHACPNA